MKIILKVNWWKLNEPALNIQKTVCAIFSNHAKSLPDSPEINIVGDVIKVPETKYLGTI